MTVAVATGSRQYSTELFSTVLVSIRTTLLGLHAWLAGANLAGIICVTNWSKETTMNYTRIFYRTHTCCASQLPQKLPWTFYTNQYKLVGREPLSRWMNLLLENANKTKATMSTLSGFFFRIEIDLANRGEENSLLW